MKKVVISVVLAVLITYVILLVPAALIYWLASLILGIDFLWKNTFIIAGIFTVIRIFFLKQKIKILKFVKILSIEFLGNL